jgi:SAM-dependent methyltransferase
LGIFSYEKFLIDSFIKDKNAQLHFRIVGCGSGREVLPLLKLFKNSTFHCEDIAENMILKAKEIIEQTERVTYEVVSVNQKSYNLPRYDICICFNNVLNYIHPHNERIKTFNNLYNSLKTNGILLGVVHTAYRDKLNKSIFFAVKGIFRRSNNKFQKKSNFGGLEGDMDNKIIINYYTKKTLKDYLIGFNNVKIDYTHEILRKTNGNFRKGSTNYIAFSAVKG